MAHSRKITPSRPKAKKAVHAPKAAIKTTHKPAAAKPAAAKPVAKPVARPAMKPAAHSAAHPAVKSGPKLEKYVAPKAGIKPAAGKGAAAAAPAVKGTLKPKSKPKVKSTPRQPAVVHPIGVLPPESISRAPQKPARPLVLPARPAAAKVARVPVADGAGHPVTSNDYPEFEQRLLEERVRVLKEMGHYENTVLKVNQRDSAGDLSGYSFHMADVGTDAMEREKAFQLASAEGRILLEINEALRRIARGEYGRCESCENPILRARLEAMPVARLCLSCKEKEERAARGMS
jgi:RNA polymerase-binding transcription factor DksA